MLYILTKEGLIDYNLVAIDGTKIKANASKKFSGTDLEFIAKKASIEVNFLLSGRV
jgi:hypothetical protein